MEKTNNTWTFVPVHKTRIIKVLDKATLIKINDTESTILPNIFKRKKESDTHIYFSLPQDFKINFRKNYYDLRVRRYVTEDKLYDLSMVAEKLGVLSFMEEKTAEEEVEVAEAVQDDDLPF